MYDLKRVSLRERLESHYQLLQGLRLADILREVSKVEVIKNVRETVEKLQGHRIRTVLLTDLPDFLCAYLIERFGFEGYVASKVNVKGRVISGAIEPLADKKLGLRKYCSWLSIPLSKCVHVGDGLNDVPVFRIVRHSVALNSKADKVNASASYKIATEDLLDVYRHLESVK